MAVNFQRQIIIIFVAFAYTAYQFQLTNHLFDAYDSARQKQLKDLSGLFQRDVTLRGRIGMVQGVDIISNAQKVIITYSQKTTDVPILIGELHVDRSRRSFNKSTSKRKRQRDQRKTSRKNVAADAIYFLKIHDHVLAEIAKVAFNKRMITRFQLERSAQQNNNETTSTESATDFENLKNGKEMPKQIEETVGKNSPETRGQNMHENKGTNKIVPTDPKTGQHDIKSNSPQGNVPNQGNGKSMQQHVQSSQMPSHESISAKLHKTNEDSRVDTNLNAHVSQTPLADECEVKY